MYDRRTERQWQSVRGRRDILIHAIRWRIERHRDEVALGLPPTEPLQPLLEYAQALRDIPKQSDPFNITWPTAP